MDPRTQKPNPGEFWIGSAVRSFSAKSSAMHGRDRILEEVDSNLTCSEMFSISGCRRPYEDRKSQIERCSCELEVPLTIIVARYQRRVICQLLAFWTLTDFIGSAQGPNPGNPGNPLGTQGPPQGPKDSGTEPREPRKPFGNTGTSPGTQGLRDRTQGTQETLGEQHRDLPMDPRIQGANLGNPGIPLGHRDLPMIPRTQDPNPGTPRKPFGAQGPLSAGNPRTQGSKPGNSGTPLGTQAPSHGPKDSGTEPRCPRLPFGNFGPSPVAY